MLIRFRIRVLTYNNEFESLRIRICAGHERDSDPSVDRFGQTSSPANFHSNQDKLSIAAKYLTNKGRHRQTNIKLDTFGIRIYINRSKNIKIMETEVINSKI